MDLLPFFQWEKKTGGVIAFVSKSSVPDEARVQHTPLVAGRVSRLSIRPVANFESNGAQHNFQAQKTAGGPKWNQN